jgi:hypothetical protein
LFFPADICHINLRKRNATLPMHNKQTAVQPVPRGLFFYLFKK